MIEAALSMESHQHDNCVGEWVRGGATFRLLRRVGSTRSPWREAAKIVQCLETVIVVGGESAARVILLLRRSILNPPSLHPSGGAIFTRNWIQNESRLTNSDIDSNSPRTRGMNMEWISTCSRSGWSPRRRSGTTTNSLRPHRQRVLVQCQFGVAARSRYSALCVVMCVLLTDDVVRVTRVRRGAWVVIASKRAVKRSGGSRVKRGLRREQTVCAGDTVDGVASSGGWDRWMGCLLTDASEALQERKARMGHVLVLAPEPNINTQNLNTDNRVINTWTAPWVMRDRELRWAFA